MNHNVNLCPLMYLYMAIYIAPVTKTKTGDRAFWVAGPNAWNSLPAPRS